MGKFRVKSALAMPEVSAVVLIGTVVENEVAAGMFVRVPLNSMTNYVVRVQSVQLAAGPVRTDVALSLEADEDEQDFWRALGVEGELLEVSEVGPE